MLYDECMLYDGSMEVTKGDGTCLEGWMGCVFNYYNWERLGKVIKEGRDCAFTGKRSSISCLDLVEFIITGKVNI